MNRDVPRSRQTVARKPALQRVAVPAPAVSVDAAGQGALDAPDITRAMSGASLFAAQGQLASPQWALALQGIAAQWSQWIELESRLLERVHADGVRLWLGWLDSGCAAWPTPADFDSLTASDSDTPLSIFGQAQAAMGEMARVWTQGANFAALRE